MVKIEIDGKQIKARDGDMVIEAADYAGIYIPRFCYHKKLSVAANCRMCLVEVEKARKPLPACATPVTDGMKVMTKSKNAIAAQKGVMEFLLINHPLDCPICDQGGECELQDVAMGYGSDVSRFSENKRVVADKNLGPLISTDMTRCIHCTRCVRFGEEIAGIKELGVTGRGEHMKIGTYIEHAIESEMSGNIIDLCPVGALTSKPFRFSTRSWEMQQRDSIAAHDCIGSNTHLHVKSGKVMRVVPKDNELINETWLSDRDRFSYQGLNSDDRAMQPMIKENGSWKTVDWETALNKAFTGINKALNSDIDKVGFLASPNATTEELYLFQKLARSQGIENLDHRLRQQDFSTESQMGLFPSLGYDVADLEKLNAALFIGSNVRKEQPIAGHRIRKAALAGGKISFINTRENAVRFPVLANIAASPADMLGQLTGVLAAAVALNKKASISASAKTAIAKAKINDEQKAIASSLMEGDLSSVVLGIEALNSANRSSLETLASAIADATNSTLSYLTEGANAAGAHIAGVLPYRAVAGGKSAKTGLNAKQMLDQDLSAYVLLGLEAEYDVANPVTAVSNLEKSECVISLTSFVTDSMKQYSDIILPVCTYAETAGTLVNAAGDWQSFNGIVPPVGEARPAWKVLRVLGNLFEVDGFDYISVEDIFNELDGLMKTVTTIENSKSKNNSIDVEVKADSQKGLSIVGGTGLLSGDAVVRRATALQESKDEIADVQIALSPSTANSLGLENYDVAMVKQGENEVSVIVWVDERLADQCVSIPMGTSTSALLGAQSDPIVIEKTSEPEIDEEEMVRASNA